MADIFKESVYLGVLVSLLSYWLGMALNKKFKLSIFNPLLVSTAVTIFVLVIFNVDYETYNLGGRYLSYLLTPATVCLAVPLYEQFELLKKHWLAIMCGIVSGILTSALTILAFALIFKFDHTTFITFFPKSITTAIGMGLSEEMNGYVSITVAAIVMTGVFGNVIGETVFKVFKINSPIAKGIGLGTASHAIGTARAYEIGEVEGAMGGLSIAVSGVLTVVAAMFFAQLI